MIKLTSQALKQINKYISKRNKGIGILVKVKTTGCSGLAYVLEYADTQVEDSEVIPIENIFIFVDKKSEPYLNGMEIDFVREGLNEGFKFNNPNERDRCGCGESFRV